MSTAVAVQDEPPVALFTGGPADVITAATDVANRFADVVKKQGLALRISQREHVLVEAWQTIGSMTGVFAVDGIVTELEWPTTIVALWSEPPDAGREPPRSSPQYPEWELKRDDRAEWLHHRSLLRARDRGLAFGYTAAFPALTRDGVRVGWGQGRCDRTEAVWVSKPNYAVQGMAETRGQSRSLSKPLRFVVKLAGYEPTIPEEMDGALTSSANVVLDHAGQETVVNGLERAWPDLDAVKYLTLLEQRLGGGITEDIGTALRAWAWFSAQPDAQRVGSPQDAAQSVTAGETPTSPPAESTPDEPPPGEPADDFKWSS